MPLERGGPSPAGGTGKAQSFCSASYWALLQPAPAPGHCAAALPLCGTPRGRPRPPSCRACWNSSASFCSEARISSVALAAACDSTSSKTFWSASESLPQRAADDREQRLGDVAGEHDVRLHLVELLRQDRRQRVLLRVHGALLQREIDLGEGDRRGVGADRLREHEVQRRRRHAQLHALHVLGLLDLLVGGHMALAVIGERDDLCLVLSS